VTSGEAGFVSKGRGHLSVEEVLWVYPFKVFFDCHHAFDIFRFFAETPCLQRERFSSKKR
jgi:hypothetical protein